MAALAMAVLLSACSYTHDSMDPVDWWHNLEGGRIAQARPAPPAANQPYPNLDTVPAAKPVPPVDPTTRARIAGTLLADRANAQYAASLAPLPASPHGDTAAAAPKPATPPAGEMNASLPAAAGPAPAAAPVPAPAAAPNPGQDAGPQIAATPGLPPIPAGPPAPAQLAGVPATTAPTPPPPTPPAPPAPPRPGAPILLSFRGGDATLAPAARTQLRQLAARRSGLPISVTGFGDGTDSDPAAQAQALPLAWRRAASMSGYLESIGVPAGGLIVTAQAIGHGGVAAITP